MARTKSSVKRMRYPVERTFSIAVGANSEVLVDVGAALSAINHRLYRQGKLYTVKMEQPLYNIPGVGLTVKKLPDTWWMQKAYHLAKSARDDQLSLSNRPRGRWDDFRVGWDSSYKTATAPSHGDYSGTWASDELQLAKVHDSTASADHEFVVFGSARDAGNALYGIIEQYDQIGNTMTGQPAGSPTVDAYTQTHPDAGLTEAAGDLLALQGDNAPYDMDSFNGATDIGAVQLGSLGQIGSGTGDGRIQIIADLPLGLVKLENGTSTGQVVQFTVMKGDYKGVKALDF